MKIRLEVRCEGCDEPVFNESLHPTDDVPTVNIIEFVQSQWTCKCGTTTVTGDLDTQDLKDVM